MTNARTYAHWGLTGPLYVLISLSSTFLNSLVASFPLACLEFYQLLIAWWWSNQLVSPPRVGLSLDDLCHSLSSHPHMLERTQPAMQSLKLNHKVIESITVSPDFEFLCAVKYSSGTIGVFLRWSLRSSSLESRTALGWTNTRFLFCSTPTGFPDLEFVCAIQSPSPNPTHVLWNNSCVSNLVVSVLGVRNTHRILSSMFRRILAWIHPSRFVNIIQDASEIWDCGPLFMSQLSVDEKPNKVSHIWSKQTKYLA